MLHFIYANDLSRNSVLATSMFRDRADQFKTRLGWDVTIDRQGYERDEYDDLNPLYVIYSDKNGRHLGSLRFLPTTGQNMLNDHFTHVMGGGTLESPFIWECTRFCLSQDAPSRIAAALMLGGGEVMRQCAVDHFVGVFDARMIRIYRRVGWSPEILGSSGEGNDQISVGLWSLSQEDRAKIARRAEIEPSLVEEWFHIGANRTPADLYTIA